MTLVDHPDRCEATGGDNPCERLVLSAEADWSSIFRCPFCRPQPTPEGALTFDKNTHDSDLVDDQKATEERMSAKSPHDENREVRGDEKSDVCRDPSGSLVE